MPRCTPQRAFPLDLILVAFADDISGWIIDGGKWLFESLNSL